MEGWKGKLTQTLCSSSLEQVVNRRANHYTLAARVHTEAANLDAVLATDVLDTGGLAAHLDESLAGVSFLVQLSDVSACHCLVEWDGDCVVDALEPDGYMGDEGHFRSKLGANFALMDVVRQRVGNEVVGQVLDVVLWGRLGSCS